MLYCNDTISRICHYLIGSINAHTYQLVGLKLSYLPSVLFLAPQLKVSDDRMTVTGEKGYSMIRATHGKLFMANRIELLKNSISHKTSKTYKNLIIQEDDVLMISDGHQVVTDQRILD